MQVLSFIRGIKSPRLILSLKQNLVKQNKSLQPQRKLAARPRKDPLRFCMLQVLQVPPLLHQPIQVRKVPPLLPQVQPIQVRKVPTQPLRREVGVGLELGDIFPSLREAVRTLQLGYGHAKLWALGLRMVGRSISTLMFRT